MATYMKGLLSVLFISVLFSSCSPKIVASIYGNTYSYKYDIVKPKTDSLLTFEDDRMKFTFAVLSNEIDFTAKNKTDQVLKIIWDDASFVQFGTVEKVMHKGVKFIDRDGTQPPSVIPPNTMLDDLITPTSNVYYRTGTYTTSYSNPGGWEKKDIFPTHKARKDTTDLSKTFVGQEISISIPVKNTDNKEIGYSFTFKVKTVNCLTCK